MCPVGLKFTRHLTYSCPKFSHYTGSLSDIRQFRRFNAYRSNSHFGHVTPTFSVPAQFHLPYAPTKYVPLRRSRSLQEVFSNEKYEKLLDRTPMTLPFAGRLFRAKTRPVRLFKEVVEEELTFKNFEAEIISVSSATEAGSSKIEIANMHENFLKVLDKKLAEEKAKPPTSFLDKIDKLNFTKSSPAYPVAESITSRLNDIDVLEETLLCKLSASNLDRSEGSIFNKIENELKTREERIKDLCTSPETPESVPATPKKIKLSKSSTPVAQTSAKAKKPAQENKIVVRQPKSTPKPMPKAVSKSTPNLQNKVTLRRKPKFCEVFSPGNFSEAAKPSSPVLSFEKKSTKGSSSLWLPFVDSPIPSAAPSVNSAFERSCNSSDEITLCIDSQYMQMKELNASAARMRTDMEEIMELHNNSGEKAFHSFSE